MDNDYVAPTPVHISSSVQEKIAKLYYRHGLICASHPYAVLSLTLLILVVCCYPVLHHPLLGSSSQEYTTQFQDFLTSSLSSVDPESLKLGRGPAWFQGPPAFYVQQVVVRSTVSPWKSDFTVADAFRAPLAQAFFLTDIVSNHRLTENSTAEEVSMSNICLQVSEPVNKRASSALPHYGCLLISPASIWTHDIERFLGDNNIIKTIFQQRDGDLDSRVLRELLFGMQWKSTGVKSLPIRARQRIIQYTVTVIFKTLNIQYLLNLHQHLREKYPQNPYHENTTYTPNSGDLVHIFFQNQYTYAEFIPLGVLYVILFLYIYFSVRKIDMVKSKWALAVSSVCTVMMSLLMSVGLCLWFGLSPTLQESEILPYLVVVIGLENMLVLTKSVVSTPGHLDVKVRIAQGLSKEGWSITKNLFTELALLTFAFCTFVPAIQEFCLLAVVGLLSDFFLQLVFFATVLSIDIHRIELADYHKANVHPVVNFRSSAHEDDGHMSQKHLETKDHYLSDSFENRTGMGATRLRPTPGPCGSSHYSTSVFVQPSVPLLVKLPKRLRFVYFWARTRMVQRGLMVCLIIWIVLLVYKSGIMEQLADNTTGFAPLWLNQVFQPVMSMVRGRGSGATAEESKTIQVKGIKDSNPTDVVLKLQHRNPGWSPRLPAQHWSTLFGYYNMSLAGRYISILPPFHLSIPVSPDLVIQMRHPVDADVTSKALWESAGGSDIGEPDFDDQMIPEGYFHPSTAVEVALAVILSAVSVVFLVYTLVALYRCMCTRNYAEWRSSWQKQHCKKNDDISISPRPGLDPDAYLIVETIPFRLKGHSQEVECLAADGNIVASSCLNGDIRVWDAQSGQCLVAIIRSRLQPSRERSRCSTTHGGSFSSDSTSSSPPSPSVGETFTSSQTNLCRNRAPETPPLTPSAHCCSPHQREYACIQRGYDFASFMEREPEVIGCNIKRRTSAVPNSFEGHDGSVDDAMETLGSEDTRMKYSSLPFQSLWCLDLKDGLIAVGCDGGRVELWDAHSGNLQNVYEDNPVSVSTVRLVDRRVIVARLDGALEFLYTERAGDCVYLSSCQSCMGCGIRSSDSEGEHSKGRPEVQSPFLRQEEFKECMQCRWLHRIRAHSRPITVLEVEGYYVVSGSLDRLVKVFHCDSASCVYTLHGHIGGITSLHIDKFSPTSAASGCQEGRVFVWDLVTGTCVYSLSAHQGAVLRLKATPMYLVSLGTDCRMCIWEKYQGHLLHSVLHESLTLCTALELLTSNILVTAKEDQLILWDVNHGEALRVVVLGTGDQSTFVRQIKVAGWALVCDYSTQLCVIHFPAITGKAD